MKIYLAVLKDEVNLEKFKKDLKEKKIKFLDYYKTLGIVKLQSEKKISEKDVEEFCESIEEEKDNLTI
ncbi:hypothetical protein HIO71_16895 [Chryseobacterium aquaticum]|jgi:hypothetical protein|uniref:Uncharacterized protein n=1 Tax=Chryseobacterium aquaticum TaxID=452084 RepID=A0A848NAS7_9FLAO|nr:MULTISPECIES: hypothetical protein [Chryseobacterium]NMR35858.1 hypothetical protein [Chryseobacterium aquaticum]NRQ47893.1 hypothetical protein [Chryseobacterium sp. C-204]